MPDRNTCVLTYSSTEDTCEAIRKLQQENFDLAHVSIVGIYSNIKNDCLTDEAESIDKLSPLFSAKKSFLIEGLGSVRTTGKISQLIVEEQNKIDIHRFSKLGMAFSIMGIPEQSIHQYESAIKAGKILLIVNSTRNEVELSCKILHNELHQATVHLA